MVSIAPTTAAPRGARWTRATAASGTAKAATTAALFVDPTDPDVVYTFNTAAYKSTDGGNTFTGFRGAPGGDDPQANWIDPTNGKRILLGYDQGAIVTLRWRRELEFVVQPEHRAGLSHLHRQHVRLLGVRHAAGRGRGAHAQPRQLRRDHADGLESGERVGMGHRDPRSARSEHRVLERQWHQQDQFPERTVDLREPLGRSLRATCARRRRSRSCGRRGTSTS